LLSELKSFQKQLGLLLKTSTEIYVKTMGDTCRRGSSFGAHNYIGQHPIQECAQLWKSTTASMDKNVLWLNWGDLQTATAMDDLHHAHSATEVSNLHGQHWWCHVSMPTTSGVHLPISLLPPNACTRIASKRCMLIFGATLASNCQQQMQIQMQLWMLQLVLWMLLMIFKQTQIETYPNAQIGIASNRELNDQGPHPLSLRTSTQTS
jgi:hypothetical protein